MFWEAIGFKSNPFGNEPISSENLTLYTGNEDKITTCQFALKSQNVIMVVEGARGVGTTSFANYLRYHSHKEKDYFTPTNEIRVQPNWNAETLLSAIIANLVTELELYHKKPIQHSPEFIDAKAVVSRIAETYRSFGVQGFSVGIDYNKSAGPVTQPTIVPSPILAHHLENLIAIIKNKLKYRKGILIQLNNLDVGVVQEEGALKQLLHVMRDYFQIDGASFILVGDIGIHRFISQHVDRLDDIINHEVDITPLGEAEFLKLIQKRVDYYRVNDDVKLPVNEDVLLYLYKITSGRLRYIFGLIERLFNKLQVGTLTDTITLNIAKPVIKDYAERRIQQCGLTETESDVLSTISKHHPIQVKDIADKLNRKSNQVSKILSTLLDNKLVTFTKSGVSRYYSPSVYALIAFDDVG